MRPIAATTHAGHAVIVCEDGTAYLLNPGGTTWGKLPALPEEKPRQPTHVIAAPPLKPLPDPPSR